MNAAAAAAADLPIWTRRDDLERAIRDHQVVIVAGETGSGKSTQLPKLCLEMGLAANGRIGHTQPRRIAARSVAERIAEELGAEVGQRVGYAVRFNDRVSAETEIKLMTDGILLAEMQRNRSLDGYSVLIIDEAHERSLNIDFLLGYLKQLLPRRPDLKLIVTSATIDTERFARHFGGAPIVEVSGRTHPVEVRYRPMPDTPLPDAIVEAVRELWRDTEGDVLVFCSGERDIRDAAKALEDADFSGADIFPLYARLSAAEQQRVFRPHRGRRVVLATNVAETSLTVPGIRSVVDPGLARISRFSARTKVQRLPIEAISQASANQRAGRCGRVAPGVCVRLYAEDDFDARPEFTEPEVLRTSLASVVLQMASLGLGRAEDFPFVEPPERRAIRDGVALLEELDAVDPEREDTAKWLTPIGRQLARLPIDPRLGRMVLEADRLSCLHEVMVIAAALSVQDPRERPRDKRDVADEFHARYQNEDSDFLTYLELWDHLERERRARSGNQFRRMCRKEFINNNRVREWHDVYRQLRRTADQLGLARAERDAERAHADRIHQALLVGLLSQVGNKLPPPKTAKAAVKRGQRGQRRSRQVYEGPRNMRFVLAPGTAASRQSPQWLMAAELVETDTLRARTTAAIDPRWLEDLGAHLVARSYTSPRWDAERGAAVVTERVTLFGLTVVAGRTINLERVNPEMARRLFIDHMLVDPEWPEHRSGSIDVFARHAFVASNAATMREAADLEARARQRELLRPPEELASWFDKRLGPDVASVRSFNAWWKRQRSSDPERLTLELGDVVHLDDALDVTAFPERFPGTDLELSYEFDPSSPVDGVTVDVPVELLGDLTAAPFSWNVPGFRSEIMEALIRQLPKDQRRTFIPIGNTAQELASVLEADDRPIGEVVAEALGRRGGFVIPSDELTADRLPPHLRPTFRILGATDEMLAAGKDLTRLQRRLDDRARRALASTRHAIEADGLTEWPDVDQLPHSVERVEAGHRIEAFPALVDRGDSVSVALLASPVERDEEMWAGVRRLLRLNVPVQQRLIRSVIDNRASLALVTSPYRGVDAWADDVQVAAFDELIRTAGGPPSSRARFRALTTWTERRLPAVVADIADQSVALLSAAHDIEMRLAAIEGQGRAASLADARRHLRTLFYDGVLTAVGAPRLPHIGRYLAGLLMRLDRIESDPQRDLQLLVPVLELERAHADLLDRRVPTAALVDLRWMLEEYRVSVFAQSLGTDGPISEKRIRRALTSLD